MNTDGAPPPSTITKAAFSALFILCALGGLGYLLFLAPDRAPPPESNAPASSPQAPRDASSPAGEGEARHQKLIALIQGLEARLKALEERRRSWQREVSHKVKESGQDAPGVSRKIRDIRHALRFQEDLEARLEELRRMEGRLSLRLLEVKHGQAFRHDAWIETLDRTLDFRLAENGADAGRSAETLADALYAQAKAGG